MDPDCPFGICWKYFSKILTTWIMRLFYGCQTFCALIFCNLEFLKSVRVRYPGLRLGLVLALGLGVGVRVRGLKLGSGLVSKWETSRVWSAGVRNVWKPFLWQYSACFIAPAVTLLRRDRNMYIVAVVVVLLLLMIGQLFSPLLPVLGWTHYWIADIRDVSELSLALV